jgi:lipoprotein-anchoring transpeptidase ErfK/SrfK
MQRIPFSLLILAIIPVSSTLSAPLSLDPAAYRAGEPDVQAVEPPAVGGPFEPVDRTFAQRREYPVVQTYAQTPSGPLYAAQTAPQYPPQYAPRYARPGDLGGGFIEFLFGGGRYQRSAPQYQPLVPQRMPAPAYSQPAVEPAAREVEPRFLPHVVNYDGDEKPGTVIINTPERYLYLVMEDGKARRYGIGVGRPGFTWAGVKTVSDKKQWPDWRPPDEMLARRPDLPRYMPGGPENPLGARALYLGSSLYRIHGSNEPWTIGQAVSSGCIRMRNQDVIELYEQVPVGAKVLVI